MNENINHTIVLIDELLEGDLRVLESINKFQQPVVIIDCSLSYQVSFGLTLFSNLGGVICTIKAFLTAPYYWNKLSRLHNLSPKRFLAGFKASFRTRRKALKVFYVLKEKYKDNNFDTIYANDLMCGITGMYLARHFNARLIYDAHEIEFHRNRKNSYLRVAFDMCVEKEVIKYASSVVVVNAPIARLYQQIYNIPSDKIIVIDNNHFVPHFNYALNLYSENNEELAIVYVGGGINGRKLESLTQNNQEISIALHGYFLGETPVYAYQDSWILGSKEYLPELMELIKYKLCIMWCCVDDICLSYRLALPNKFFQAIAIGIPVIAYKGTYLAEIVTKYDLGYIYDDENLQFIVKDMNSYKNYYKLLVSISKFQYKLFEEKLVL